MAKGKYIDWCPSCAVLGAQLKHQDVKHQMFAYIFTRIAKDIPEKHCLAVPEDGSRFSYNIYHKWLDEYYLDTPIAQLWHKKSYWKFMEHVLNESLGIDYEIVNIVFENRDVSIYMKKRK